MGRGVRDQAALPSCIEQEGWDRKSRGPLENWNQILIVPKSLFKEYEKGGDKLFIKPPATASFMEGSRLVPKSANEIKEENCHTDLKIASLRYTSKKN